MRAAGLDFSRKRFAFTDLPEPALAGDGDVLFRVIEGGVCGTDRELAAFRLGYPPPGEDTLVLGHEALGEVVAVGRGVADLAPGDLVVPSVRRPCSGPCPSCARGRRDLCVTGRYTERGIFGRHGYFSEFAVDAAADLVRLPASLADVAVLIEPLSVVEKAVETALRIHEPGACTALVLGAGPVGLLAAMALQARGLAASVYSLEPADHPRARLAAAAGLRYLTSLSGVRADIVIEAAGSAQAAAQGVACLAPLGVCCVLGGIDRPAEVRFLDMLVNNQAVFGSVNASPRAFELAVEDLRRFDRAILARMILRKAFADIPDSVAGASSDAPKVVHMVMGCIH